MHRCTQGVLVLNGGGGGDGGVATVLMAAVEVVVRVVARALAAVMVSLEMILRLQIVRLSCLLKRRPLDLRMDGQTLLH